MSMFHGFEWDEAQSPPWWASTGMPAQPALDLNFTSGVYRRNGLIRDLDQIMGFARATPATYVDADGAIQTAGIDVPRFDWTGGERALLLEDAATNLLKQSGTLSTYWTLKNTTKTFAGPSPVESVDGIRLVRNSTSASCYVAYGAGISATDVYTASVVAKRGDLGVRMGLRIQAVYPDRGDAVFDLQAGALIGTSQSGTNTQTRAGIEELSDGWFMCWVTTKIDISTSPEVSVLLGSTKVSLSNVSGWEGASGELEDIIIVAPQFEAGNAPTSYIPTAGSPVTRAADIAAPVDLSGVDLSAGYTAAVFGWLDGVRGSFDRLLQLDGGGDETRQVALYASSSSGFRGAIFSGGVVQAGSAGAGLRPLPAEFRIAWSVGSNIYDFAQDGVAYDHSDHVVYDPPEFMRLGMAPVGGQPKRLRLSRVSIYPSVMTTAQLEEITA